MRAQQLSRLIQEDPGLQEVVIGVEGHQYIKTRLLVFQEIFLQDMDAGIKGELFSGHIRHALGDIHPFDLAGAGFQQIQEHGAAATTHIQHAGTASGNRDGGSNHPGRLGL